jgi:hypothetical protein
VVTLLIALMMEAARSSETLVNFYQTTRRYNPEDSHLRTHRRENLKPYSYELLVAMDVIPKWTDVITEDKYKLIPIYPTCTSRQRPMVIYVVRALKSLINKKNGEVA